MNHRLSSVPLVAGVFGTLTCIGAMVLAIAGVSSTAATVSMGSTHSHARIGDGAATGAVGWLVDQGPVVLLISIAAVVIALAVKRPLAAIPALVGGLILYGGMYSQERLVVMYLAIISGLTVWLIAGGWANRWLPVHRTLLPKLAAARTGQPH